LIFEIDLHQESLNFDDENISKIPDKVFHGTNLGYVHSILKNGLKIYSNTKNQLHGSAYGEGIYTSTSFITSYGYCKKTSTKIWKQSDIKIGICMFLCDYHHNKTWNNERQLPNNFRIARENGYVIPRYLYVEYV
jgi:ubiquitin-conjugating enzyme E2 Q